MTETAATYEQVNAALQGLEDLFVVSTVSRFVEQTWTSAVCAALIQSSFPSVPATFEEVIGSGHVLERMWSGTSPLWTSS